MDSVTNNAMKSLDLASKSQVFESEDQLVIGLDFGTTFSGIAYAFAHEKKPELVSIMDWPGLEGVKQPKIPTAICYDSEDKNSFTWGGMKHKGDVVAGVKLLLDPDQPRPLYLPESTAKSDLKRLGKPAVDVAADFIGAMYKHAMARIESKVPADYLSMCQKKFVLSVPAVYSDRAKDLTLKAARKAGISPVTLIKEPEAAAMYTLHVMKEKSLSVGDAFVICDAGGGTVDLISYEIMAMMPKLELKELVPGKGGMAGSLGLNKRFEQAVKELVGEDQYYHLRKTRGFEQATQQFDRSIKTAFRSSDDEDYLVNFPMAKLQDDPSNNLTSNCWAMKGGDVKKIFDPLINDIERLVDEQVNLVKVKRMAESHAKAKEIKAIFLVGGFGSSEYLKTRLEELHQDVQVIQPHDSWSAIVKGAVLSQLPQEASIISNQATRHYGVSAHALFDEQRDKGQHKFWDPSLGMNRVYRMTWYIHQGDDLLREQTIKFRFFRSLPEGFAEKQLIFEDNLIQSESRTAPVHPSPAATKTNCVLTANLTSVDRAQFKKRAGADGLTYYDVYYDLAITIQPAMMKFALEVKGKEMGTVQAKYD